MFGLFQCFRITPFSPDAAFAERMRLACGTGMFLEELGLNIVTPLFPDEFKFGVIVQDMSTMKLQVVMFDS